MNVIATIVRRLLPHRSLSQFRVRSKEPYVTPTDLSAVESTTAVLAAFRARIARISTGSSGYLASVAIEHRAAGGAWRQVDATEVMLAVPTEQTLDMLVEGLLSLRTSPQFEVRVTASVMDEDGNVLIAYRTR